MSRAEWVAREEGRAVASRLFSPRNCAFLIFGPNGPKHPFRITFSQPMAQLPYVEPDEEADPVTKGVYDRAEARFEMVLNIFKISGNAPEIAEKM